MKDENERKRERERERQNMCMSCVIINLPGANRGTAKGERTIKRSQATQARVERPASRFNGELQVSADLFSVHVRSSFESNALKVSPASSRLG